MAALDDVQVGELDQIAAPETLTVADKELLDDLIRQYARRLALDLNDAAVDSDDVAQEFWVRLLPALANYRRHRGQLRRFAARLLKRQRVSMLRTRYAEKRTPRSVQHTTSGHCSARVMSLPGETVSNTALKRHRGWTEKDPLAAVDQHHDRQVVMRRLSPAQAQLARQLMTLSVTEIAHLEGVPRTTLNDRVRALRKSFEEAGLKDFVD